MCQTMGWYLPTKTGSAMAAPAGPVGQFGAARESGETKTAELSLCPESDPSIYVEGPGHSESRVPKPFSGSLSREMYREGTTVRKGFWHCAERFGWGTCGLENGLELSTTVNRACTFGPLVLCAAILPSFLLRFSHPRWPTLGEKPRQGTTGRSLILPMSAGRGPEGSLPVWLCPIGSKPAARTALTADSPAPSAIDSGLRDEHAVRPGHGSGGVDLFSFKTSHETVSTGRIIWGRMPARQAHPLTHDWHTGCRDRSGAQAVEVAVARRGLAPERPSASRAASLRCNAQPTSSSTAAR
jgi:hypothetical protein